MLLVFTCFRYSFTTLAATLKKHCPWCGVYCCIDTDECAVNNGGCGASAVCTNTPGHFICSESTDCTGKSHLYEVWRHALVSKRSLDRIVRTLIGVDWSWCQVTRDEDKYVCYSFCWCLVGIYNWKQANIDSSAVFVVNYSYGGMFSFEWHSGYIHVRNESTRLC